MFKHFQLAIIATILIMLLAIAVGCAGVAVIVSSRTSARVSNERASMLGTGVATLAGIAMAPFWILAAAKSGQERRAGLEKARMQASKKKRPHSRK